MKPTVERKLGEIFEFKNGRGFKKSEWSASGLPIIRIQNLNSKLAPFNYFDGEYSADILIKRGDLLFSWSGTVGTSFGSHIWDGDDGLLNQHIFKVSHGDEIARRYAFYALRYITADIEKAVDGAVGLTHITKEKLLGFTIPLPPIGDQQRIVENLDAALEAVRAAKKNADRNNLNAQRLFGSHLDSVFNVGKTWEIERMERVLRDQPRNGWSPPSANHSDTGIPVLTLSAVTGFMFRPDKIKYTSAKTESHRHYWVHNGDLLITRSNTPELVGHVAIAEEIAKPTIYPDLIMRMTVLPERIDTRFLYYQLRTTALRREIMSKAHGANPTMKKISKSVVQSLPILVPPLHTQKAIVKSLDTLGADAGRLTSLYKQKSRALKDLETSLLSRAFSHNL